MVALAAAACGSDDDPADDPTTPSADTQLTITLDSGAEGEPAHAGLASVSCPGDEASVCDLVAALRVDSAAPVPADTACTEIYGGPDVVELSGTLNGESVDTELTRANGCEIDRFDRFTPLLKELFPGYEPGSAIAP